MIRQYLRQSRLEIVLATLLSLMSAAASTVVLVWVNKSVSGDSHGEPLGAFATGFSLILVSFATSVASHVYLSKLSSRTISRARLDLSQRFLSLGYDKLLEFGRHRVTGVLIEDVSKISLLFLLIPQVFFNLLTLLFCFAYLYNISPILFGMFIIVLTASVGASIYMLSRTSKAFIDIREQQDELFSHFRAIAEGKKELTLNDSRAQHFMENVLGKSIESNKALVQNAHKWFGYNEAWSGASIFFALAFVIYFSQAMVHSSNSVLMQFVLISLFVVGPLNFIVAVSKDISGGLASIKHIDGTGLLSAHERGSPSVECNPLATELLAPELNDWRVIEIRDVGYSYPAQISDSKPIAPISLVVQRGQLLFIVGGNGTGKSTLGMLLCGLLTPSEGGIFIDGLPKSTFGHRRYMNLFSSVFFDFFLFEHFIDRHGAAADDHRVQKTLEKLWLDKKVFSTDGKVSTLNLSQGQRKRLALAQCYLDDRDIYFFDEWAADQDHEFKNYFYLTLLPEMKASGKTVIVISHDERYFDVADSIIDLNREVA